MKAIDALMAIAQRKLVIKDSLINLDAILFDWALNSEGISIPPNLSTCLIISTCSVLLKLVAGILSSRLLLNMDIETAPIIAIAISAAILEIALLTPEAAPENSFLTVRADLVRGEMTMAMPSPNNINPGMN